MKNSRVLFVIPKTNDSSIGRIIELYNGLIVHPSAKAYRLEFPVLSADDTDPDPTKFIHSSTNQSTCYTVASLSQAIQDSENTEDPYKIDQIIFIGSDKDCNTLIASLQPLLTIQTNSATLPAVGLIHIDHIEAYQCNVQLKNIFYNGSWSNAPFPIEMPAIDQSVKRTVLVTPLLETIIAVLQASRTNIEKAIEATSQKGTNNFPTDNVFNTRGSTNGSTPWQTLANTVETKKRLLHERVNAGIPRVIALALDTKKNFGQVIEYFAATGEMKEILKELHEPELPNNPNKQHYQSFLSKLLIHVFQSEGSNTDEQDVFLTNLPLSYTKTILQEESLPLFIVEYCRQAEKINIKNMIALLQQTGDFKKAVNLICNRFKNEAQSINFIKCMFQHALSQDPLLLQQLKALIADRMGPNFSNQTILSFCAITPQVQAIDVWKFLSNVDNRKLLDFAFEYRHSAENKKLFSNLLNEVLEPPADNFHQELMLLFIRALPFSVENKSKDSKSSNHAINSMSAVPSNPKRTYLDYFIDALKEIDPLLSEKVRLFNTNSYVKVDSILDQCPLPLDKAYTNLRSDLDAKMGLAPLIGALLKHKDILLQKSTGLFSSSKKYSKLQDCIGQSLVELGLFSTKNYDVPHLLKASYKEAFDTYKAQEEERQQLNAPTLAHASTI